MDISTLEDHRTDHPLARGVPPDWACEWAEDEFGVQAGFAVGQVVHRLRWIPPWRFWMGSPEDETGRFDGEGPRHLVTITQGFWLGEVPCTQALWEVVMGEYPSHFQGEKTQDDQDAERPVEQVSWEECQAFTKRLGEVLRSPGWRLPWESQWEYACRAGTEEATYGGGWASDEEARRVLDGIGWYGENSKSQTHVVGQKRANAWGLYDMLGNVWEWCGDGDRQYETRAAPDPRGSDLGSLRVLRGGSWLGGARFVRAAFRYAYHPSIRFRTFGFRLARGPAGAE